MSEENICILKIQSCPSLSGRSTLTYHVGCNSRRDIYFRLLENTGKGNFNKDWVPLAQLDAEMTSGEKPISVGLFKPMFQGKSVNTASFVLAVLIAEGLIKTSEDILHGYERIDSTGFKKDIQALMDSDREIPPSKTAKVKETANKSQISKNNS